MKSYPSISYPDSDVIDKPCHAFYKYDGSNLRFEWNKKRGWYKYGTRTRLFDRTDPDFGCAVDIFLNDLGIGIDKVLRDKYKKFDQAIVFAEFFGKNSFAGQHVATDPKELVLFDVNIHKKGIIDPVQFLNDFGHLKIAEVVYTGLFSQTFIQDVCENKLPVVEGVIAKGGSGHGLWFRKVKTSAYKEKLKTVFGHTWEKYW